MSDDVRVDDLRICSISWDVRDVDEDGQRGDVILGTEGMGSLELLLPQEYISRFPLGSTVDVVIRPPEGWKPQGTFDDAAEKLENVVVAAVVASGCEIKRCGEISDAALCDWMNDAPNAWKNGYDGVAYPDISGVEMISDGKHAGYVQWGDYIVKVGPSRFVHVPRRGTELSFAAALLNAAGLRQDGGPS